MKKYDHKRIEKKWQKEWKAKTKGTKDSEKGKKNFYLLAEFPYPSGNLHVGHWYAFALPDIFARFKRAQGLNVLYPIGYDAFGLPAENAAIKRGLNPRKWTYANMAFMEKQFASMGGSFDWSRKVVTCDPTYYKWTQWQFIQFFKKGLAYQKETPANWCPSCKTVLANEQLVAGKCERCGTEVEQRNMLQWNLAITKYADRLVDDLDALDWPDQIKDAQRNWIGRSEGAHIDFKIKDTNHTIKVFTTRADTLFGATYVVLAPEHPLVATMESIITNKKDVHTYIAATKRKTDLERQENKEKTGVRLEGITAINPATKEEIPVYIADYVLAHYGTGAVMAVPAHDERDFAFAQKYHSPIKHVVIPSIIDDRNPHVEGKKVVFRNTVLGIVRDPATKQLLTLKWKKQPWTTFVIGGIEEGEDVIAAAEREIHEETGYKNLKFIRVIGGPIQSHYFAAHKDQNRVSHTHSVLFELTDESTQDTISEKETATHELQWVDESNIVAGSLNHAELPLILSRMRTSEAAYTGTGILINSGEFNGISNEESKSKIATYVGGEMVNTYRLRDWGVSRQRYWGVPIPMVHCATCAGTHKQTHDLSLNFRINRVWDAILSGEKTVETRLLNPEEPERYFGNTKAGDVLKFVNKNTNAAVYARVKKMHIYKTLAEFFEDKETMQKTLSHAGLPKTLKQLEQRYTSLSPSYAEKIKTNGLIAWEFDLITEAVPVPEKELPVKLPEIKDYLPTGDGKSPLAKATKWVNVKCPKCKGKAQRETDTLDTFVDSSWYYLRYTDPKNTKEFAARKKQDEWMPIDLYSGGSEHTTMHVLYSRFWHKALYDLKLVKQKEPYLRRMNRGLIMGPDGQKMSKSKGNVIDPDEVVARLGADTVRLYLAFIGPYNEPGSYPWNPDSIIGVRRFLERTWALQEKLIEKKSKETDVELHKTIAKLTDDIQQLKYNTAVAQMMIFLNMAEKHGITEEQYATFLQVLAPFAPHITEELWHTLGNKKSIHIEKWPKYDSKKLKSSEITIAVQVNSKVRGTITIAPTALEKEAVIAANENESVAKWIEGKEVKKIIYVPGRILNIVVEA